LSSQPFIDSYRNELERLAEQSLLRVPDDGEVRDGVEQQASRRGVPFVDVSSNDYLGMSGRRVGPDGRFMEDWKTESPVEGAEVSRETSVGAGASRLLAGTHPAHRELEGELAAWLGHESALVFSSGYAANVGALSALLGPSDQVFSDALNHASLIDGCRLARAKIQVFPHGDAQALQRRLAQSTCQGRTWIVTESLFSMDGDPAPLPALADLARKFGAGLYVDEAHALGVMGPEGAGLCRELGVQPTVLLGTFGKALGTQGAFLALPNLLRTFLWNRARAFVYSTAPSPLLAFLTLRHLHQVRAAEPARARLRELGDSVRATLAAEGIPTIPEASGPIIPILVGESARALLLAEQLRAEGILVFAIRPPTVPAGTARLRLTLTAELGPEQLNHLLSTIVRLWREF